MSARSRRPWRVNTTLASSARTKYFVTALFKLP
jgi:hypothetical protein